ncbi:MAG: hypothetical protein FWG68_08730 [Defluviitaleaceae bacterium]|nr:hypothetical protein [Defluviitaleaceae bacterium]
MKQKLQGIVIGIVLTTLLFSTVSVFAAAPQTIEVIFGNVRTTLFGQEIISRDAQGAIVEPLTYNGTVFIPVDTILQALQDNAQWNAATSTLNFGAPSNSVAQPTRERIPLHRAAPFYESGRTGASGNTGAAQARNSDSVTMGGNTYENVIVYNSSSGNWGSLVGGANGAFTLHNLNAEFSLFTGYIGHVSGTAQLNATVEIRGDGRLLQTYEVRATDLPIPFEVQVQGVRQLRIDVNFPRGVDIAAPGGPRTAATYALVGFFQ